jgi:hypothetical protein
MLQVYIGPKVSHLLNVPFNKFGFDSMLLESKLTLIRSDERRIRPSRSLHFV